MKVAAHLYGAAGARMATKARSARRCLMGSIVSAVLAANLTSAPAHASIPVGVRLIIVSADIHDQALGRGFAKILEEYAAFLIAGSPVYRTAVVRCLENGADQEACVRGVLTPGDNDKDLPPVVVVVRRTGSDQHEWRCIGAGDQAYAPARQTVSLRMAEAMAGDASARFAARKIATDCILAAASEAQGRVRS